MERSDKSPFRKGDLGGCRIYLAQRAVPAGEVISLAFGSPDS